MIAYAQTLLWGHAPKSVSRWWPCYPFCRKRTLVFIFEMHWILPEIGRIFFCLLVCWRFLQCFVSLGFFPEHCLWVHVWTAGVKAWRRLSNQESEVSCMLYKTRCSIMWHPTQAHHSSKQPQKAKAKAQTWKYIQQHTALTITIEASSKMLLSQHLAIITIIAINERLENIIKAGLV